MLASRNAMMRSAVRRLPATAAFSTGVPKVTATGKQVVSEHSAIPAAIVLCDTASSLKHLQDKGIRPHMYTYRSWVDTDAWSEQHAALVQTLKDHAHPNTTVTTINEVVDFDSHLKGNPALKGENPTIGELFLQCPNMTYMRDPIFSLPWEPGTFIHCSHQPDCRSWEPLIAATAAENLGFKELFPDIERHKYKQYEFDGGDLVPFVYNDNVRCLLVGIGGNTNVTSAMRLAQELIPLGHCDEVIAIQMCAGRMNLDECFVPVSSEVVAAHVPSLLWADRFTKDHMSAVDPANTRFDFAQWIRDLGYHMTFDGSPNPQTVDESLDSLNTNYICLGHSNKVVGYAFDDNMLRELDRLKVEVVAVDAPELLLGDGGVRCMTRPLYM